ncbi:hypothetical protein A2U01_0091426, partial [Trifolium medium]|nr:hypothetical protein [Trifolium medium]
MRVAQHYPARSAGTRNKKCPKQHNTARCAEHARALRRNQKLPALTEQLCA